MKFFYVGWLKSLISGSIWKRSVRVKYVWGVIFGSIVKVVLFISFCVIFVSVLILIGRFNFGVILNWYVSMGLLVSWRKNLWWIKMWLVNEYKVYIFGV